MIMAGETRQKMPKSMSLDVYVHDTKVGVLSWFEGDEHRFKLDAEYGAESSETPILSLSLKTAEGRFDHHSVRKSMSQVSLLEPFL